MFELSIKQNMAKPETELFRTPQQLLKNLTSQEKGSKQISFMIKQLKIRVHFNFSTWLEF